MMTYTEIKEIVRLTVKECERERLLKRADDVAYSEIQARLFEYYKRPEKYPEIDKAVHSLTKDLYFEIVPRYYRDRIQLDQLAEMLGVDISTVAKNKKRLALEIYRQANIIQ